MIKRIGVVALLAVNLAVAHAPTVHVHLTGAHEVPPVKTRARGSGVLEVAPNGKVTGTILTHGVNHATMAHIHEGTVTSNGAPIIALQREPHGAWRVPAGAKLSAAEYRRFLAGDLYANVHCAKHPDGMSRGQLRP